MIDSLYELGRYIDETEGIKSAFKSDFELPEEGDLIAQISIEKKGIVKCEVLRAGEEIDPELHGLYYKGGNPSVTGTLGIMGVSPFFFQLEKLNSVKLSKSKGYYEKEIYKDNIEKIKEVKNYLSYLEDNTERIRNIINNCTDKNDNIKWIYVNTFQGDMTTSIHDQYIGLFLEKARNKAFPSIKGKCDLCGKEKELTYPELPFFALDVRNYTRNLKGLSEISSEDIRTKICTDCKVFVEGGWKYLLNIFDSNYLLIPTLKTKASGNQKHINRFIKTIRNEDLSDFERINNVLHEQSASEALEFTFLIYKKEQQKLKIKRRINNYKLFEAHFEKLPLIEPDDETFKYLNYADPNYRGDKSNIGEITSFFDIELILKSFFPNDRNYPLSFYFYQLYYLNPSRDKRFKRIHQIFKHRLYKYRDNLVTFIYEVEPRALSNEMLNEIVLSFIMYEIRNKKSLFGNSEYRDLNLEREIARKLNYYNFLKEEVINANGKCEGKVMLKEEIKVLEKSFASFGDSDKAKIIEIVVEDERSDLLYYLIGNFIRKIDNTRSKENKNRIFERFLASLNRKNIKDRFQKMILQDQHYYIQGRSSKVKFIFDLIKYNLDELFEDEDYENIAIALITGYYSKDMLKTEVDNSRKEVYQK